ncbi:alkanesulfonate monooxygenase SsuD/methylene tetrahydromethanopterin reductase-like flavin-dependent oxidoreductase (luciferase family) [Kribbella steppae]|uniref:Alkanesulfonate monooxygenase SsuD/methylene tetrahydromethanopterin reductase-like flavin-dependent oxidoreductase (Luciferase family) n=1 Tax=Kribbella steppae TaxID=2512223 RepID=A0A4V6NMZ2_9ACTN|nr:LLM class flavin-dependent oxidoreductase [Kribbella steppae]TCO21316.1 alkanesulfonate monooxygenase SsuD/methylene tetrahydromethanopterin reductase-like flavin-dependent oxidoreductase (luciferase family) [Kribbella steppae]
MEIEFGVLMDVREEGYGGERVDEVVVADRLGFDGVWLSEHHLTGDGMLPSPLVMAGVLAARTSRIRVGTNILVLPLHHPLRVAEDAAVVDLVSGGRLTLGVGQGYSEREFAAFGVDRRRRGALLEEGVRVIRSAWSEVAPRPRGKIPIYVAGVTAAGLRRAARLGDGVIIYCATPADLIARRKLLDEVVDNPPPLICTGIMHVDEDADRAWADAAPGIAYLEGEIASYGGTEPPALNREDYLVGTPEDVAARLIAVHEATRFVHFAHWLRLPTLSHDAAMRSLELIAGRVIPAVRAGVSR